MTDKPVIEERENGPLVVKGLASMTGSDGAAVDCKPVMALCRCGQSQSKPFCDGTHNKIGFESRGGEPAGKDVLLPYKGEHLTVLYNPRLCSHAAECGKRASKAFNPAQKPWVQPDKVSVEKIEEVVCACPSGALQIKGRGHTVPNAAQITVEPNGPYRVQGVSIDADPAGEGASHEKLVLCRCGLSGNKPYCDGTHRDAGWNDD